MGHLFVSMFFCPCFFNFIHLFLLYVFVGSTFFTEVIIGKLMVHYASNFTKKQKNYKSEWKLKFIVIFQDLKMHVKTAMKCILESRMHVTLMCAVVMLNLLCCSVYLRLTSLKGKIEKKNKMLNMHVSEISLSGLVRNDEKNIFFLQTNHELQSFNLRDLCAYESAALHNPDYQVIILINERSKFLPVPLYFSTSYSNVNFKWINMHHLAMNSPSWNHWKSGKLNENNKNALHDMSDMLRTLILARFGGIYLDNDAISLREIPRIGKNFITTQIWKKFNNVAAGIMGFEKNHPFLQLALQDQVCFL